MLKLNNLRDNPGSKRRSKDLGRGIGSGKGKTSGRGGKGQTARSGVSVKFREGGQLPLFRRLPKRGFKNYTRVEYEVINLGHLQFLVDEGIISASETITPEFLMAHKLYRGKKPIKLLANGEVTSKLHIVVDNASQRAIELVAAQGGKVELTVPLADQ
jgi:large subunit ribosomal protein L15